MNVEFCEGITETLDILEHMKESDVKKISKKFLDFLEENKSNTYKPNLDYSKPINEMKLKEKTKNILAVIYIKYWCTSEEKSGYMNLINENEVNFRNEMKEKYNPDNIFKKEIKEQKDEVLKEIETQSIQTQQTEELVVPTKETIFSKILKSIKKFFSKSI